MSDTLSQLRALLEDEGGLIAKLLSQEIDPDRLGGADSRDGPESDAASGGSHNGTSEIARLAAAGPRARGRREQYELLMEAVYEGYLLHYHTPRIVKPTEADLGLLAGDRLYALGLDRLVKLGDVEAVTELADVITLSALAHGGGDEVLAEAIWTAGARAVGWGTSPQYEQAKALVRAGSPVALQAMRDLDRG